MECELFKVHLPVHNSGLLDAFVNMAQSQKSGFVDVFPWHIARNKDILMIISASNLMELRSCKRRSIQRVPTRDTNICGWLSAIVFDKSVYLAEISSRRNADGKAMYKGIGKAMFDELVKWSIEHGKDYIYLYPLNDEVATIYKKWNLTKVCYKANSGDKIQSKFMFYKLNLLPSQNQVKAMDPDISTTDFDTISDVLSASQKSFMKRLLESEDKSLYDEIIDNIQCILSLCDDEDELKTEIEKYFSSVVPPRKFE